LVQHCLLSKFHCILSLYFFLYHSFFALFVGSFHFMSTIWWHSSSSKTCEFSNIYCIWIIMLFVLLCVSYYDVCIVLVVCSSLGMSLHNTKFCIIKFLVKIWIWWCCYHFCVKPSNECVATEHIVAMVVVWKFLKHKVTTMCSNSWNTRL
jgi:hypothetical protein